MCVIWLVKCGKQRRVFILSHSRVRERACDWPRIAARSRSSCEVCAQPLAGGKLSACFHTEGQILIYSNEWSPLHLDPQLTNCPARESVHRGATRARLCEVIVRVCVYSTPEITKNTFSHHEPRRSRRANCVALWWLSVIVLCCEGGLYRCVV